MFFKKKIKKKKKSYSSRIIGRGGNKNFSLNTSRTLFPAFIIFLGFISLTFTIFFLIKEINPLIKNQQLKYLCTYELGNKKDDTYKKAKLKLDKMVGDGNKFCRNFIFPKNNKKSIFKIFPFIKDVLFRIVF